jgi:CheY-like chemotaxis protein
VGDSYGAWIHQKLGYDVISAKDGVDALALLHAGVRPCLIVLDLGRPRTPGFAFRAEQLADPHLVQCPVIVCSDRLDTGLYLEQLAARVYLRQPVDRDTLLRVVESVCSDAHLN